MDDKSQEQQLKRQELQRQLNEVENKLADLKARWPYHSVQPRLVAEREDLEEERERLLNLIKSL
ncbi:hypothetical protein REC12_20085 [Desulfosporosinus sp. PR]|uniref:hypothetical protein n=1 Tax=Candidatus Desulfosporosinus nitrosoreducens TaxID=3401928 RepID=UPI0027FE9346|nr:hypothetical protein [Desulfosporosinus sp. PR]MDQ7095898.1 hypothetical protein [Desulfosporosinus sp. PR]